MNTQVKITLSEYKKKLSGYVGLLFYRYSNLCVKAEPASLLSANIFTDYGMEQIEDVAAITPGDTDETLRIYPYDNANVIPIMKALLHEHPEFKLEVFKCINNEEVGALELPEYCSRPTTKETLLYIIQSVAEVDKVRRDYMTDAAKTYHDEAKENIEQNAATYPTNILSLARNEKQEDVDKLKNELESIRKLHLDKVKELHDNKLSEIEQGYQYYLEHHDSDASANDLHAGRKVKL